MNFFTAWTTTEILVISVIWAFAFLTITLSYREKYHYYKIKNDCKKQHIKTLQLLLDDRIRQDVKEKALANKLDVKAFLANSTNPELKPSGNWYHTSLQERERWVTLMEGFNACMRLSETGTVAEAQDILVKTMLEIMNRESGATMVGRVNDTNHKYAIYASAIRNIQTGEIIPPEEPIFIIRGKDPLGPRTLLNYAHQCATPEVFTAVAAMAKEFEAYQAKLNTFN